MRAATARRLRQQTPRRPKVQTPAPRCRAIRRQELSSRPRPWHAGHGLSSEFPVASPCAPFAPLLIRDIPSAAAAQSTSRTAADGLAGSLEVWDFVLDRGTL